MNNLKYYQDGLAYDFSLFAPAQKEEERKGKKNNITYIPNDEKRKARLRKAAVSRVSGKVTAILVTVFVLAMLSGNILLRSQINETEHKIAVIEDEINVAESNSVVPIPLTLSLHVNDELGFSFDIIVSAPSLPKK